MSQTKAQLIDGKAAEIQFNTGSASAPTISFTGDTNTGIYSPGADQLAISTNGAQRLLIEADGDINIDSGGVFYNATNNRLGIGTASPSVQLHVSGTGNNVLLASTNDVYPLGIKGTGATQIAYLGVGSSNALQIYVSTAERARIDSSGTFRVKGAGTAGVNDAVQLNGSAPANSLLLDASGRLLVGTSSTSGETRAVFTGSANFPTGSGDVCLNLGQTPGTTTGLGLLNFTANNGSDRGASITGRRDGGTWTSGSSHPGALVFSTTADGASSPTERMRISQDGAVKITQPGGTSFGNTTYGIVLGSSGYDNSGGAPGVRIGTFVSGDTPGARQAGIQIFPWTQNDATPAAIASIYADGTTIIPGVYIDTVGATNRDLYIDSSGKFGYVSSIRASKANILPIADTNWLYDLEPVSFNRLKKDKNDQYTDEHYSETEYGLIAEDVELVAPELCFYDEVDGQQELRGVHYNKLIAPLLRAVQELKVDNESLKARVAALEAQ